MQVRTNSTRAWVGKSFARASDAQQRINNRAYRVCIDALLPPLFNELAALVDQRNSVLAEDRRNGRSVLGDELLDGPFPLGFPVSNAHRDFIIELDAGLRFERNHGQGYVRYALGVIAPDGAPHDCGVDLALRQVLVDD